MARKVITISTIKKLYGLSGNRCAFPGCQENLIDGDGDLISQICHIESAEVGGERYNPNQTDDDRRAFENLIVLCPKHHIKTNDVSKYPVQELKRMKANHESQYVANPYQLPQEFTEKILSKAEEMFDRIYQNTDATNRTVNNMDGTMNGMLKILKSISTVQVVDDNRLYTAQLQFIRDLRADKKPTSALSALEKFRSEKWDSLTAELKFKVLANTGILLIELGRTSEAVQPLVEIADLGHESGDAYSFVCLGYSLASEKEGFDRYFTKAKSLEAENINLWIAYLRLYGKLKPFEELQSEIPESVLNDRLIRFSMGQILVDSGSISDGLALMSSSIETGGKIDPLNWQLVLIYLRYRLKYIVEPIAITSEIISDKERIILNDAVGLMNRTLEELKGTELYPVAWSLLLYRGQCFRILGNRHAAIVDFEEAWRVTKSCGAFMQLINIYTIDKDWRRGRRLIAEKAGVSCGNSTERAHLEFGVSRFEAADGNIEVAISNLEQCLELDGVDRLKVLNDIAIVCLEADRNDEAMKYAKQAVEESPMNIEANFFLGTCYLNFRETTIALTMFDVVEELLDDTVGSSENWYSIGLAYLQAKEYQKAMRCFGKVAIRDRLDDVNLRMMICHFHLGEFDKVIALGKGRYFPEIRSVTHHEVLLKAHGIIGEKGEFKEVLSACLKMDDASTRDQFRLCAIKLYDEWGDAKRAVELASEIEHPEKLVMHHMYAISGLLLREGQIISGLEMGYNARIRYYDVGEAHKLYFETWMTFVKEDELALFPEEILEDCGVDVESQNGVKTRYLLTRDARIGGRNILRPTDLLCRLLLGKHVGDVIEVPNVVGPGSKLKVVAILNKYVFALQESLDLLQDKYSDISGMIFGQF